MNKDLLNSLTLPDDIKKLDHDDEKELCREIREKIITTVSQNGGHLSSNLGVVELTVAIHKVFESPKDKIVFDVGHQCYTHKLLTGRLHDFSSLRKKDGISGFSKPRESEHDPLVSGHSSTSISAALGMSEAMKLKGDNHHVIAVIGDGALTGGLAYEGLNTAGKSKTNIIIIVNYNEMSISKNIGGISEYLSKVRTKKSYRDIKSTAGKALDALPIIGKPIKKTISLSKSALRGRILNSTFFEDFGFEYIGPVNGHDLIDLEEALKAAKSFNKPVVVQVNTVKGKGYKPAENNPGEFHGVSTFDVKTGKLPEKAYNFTDDFGIHLSHMAQLDKRICAITAAMKYGTGLNHFAKQHPERFYDVGIAEEHAVTFASGLSAMGMIPVFAVYSSFLQRCYDQLVHDISISGLHCVIAVCNCGIVGEDGETHQGLLDIPFATTIPGVTIYSPSCCEELRTCMDKAIFDDSGLVMIRLPKGAAVLSNGIKGDYDLTERNSDKLIVAYGREADIASLAAQKLGYDFLHILKVFPINDEIVEIIRRYNKAYMFEECSREGSIGQRLEARCENIDAHAISGYVQHMKVCEALDLYRLSEEGIIAVTENEERNGKT